MQRCPHCCAGELKIIAAILERAVIEKIVSYLGLDTQPAPKGRARASGRARRGCTSLLEPFVLSNIYRHGLPLPCSQIGALV